MDLREYQERVRLEDAATGWDRLTTPQLVCHFAEEAGEVVKAVNHAMTRAEVTDDGLAAIAGELADTLWFVAKLANRFGVSLDEEAALQLARAPVRVAEGAGALSTSLTRLARELDPASE